jgi:hypothetical protein
MRTWLWCGLLLGCAHGTEPDLEADSLETTGGTTPVAGASGASASGGSSAKAGAKPRGRARALLGSAESLYSVG